MTIFEKEWNGELGEFRAKRAKEEVRQLMARRDEIEVEEDGAAKWKDSGRYLPEDVVRNLIYGGAGSWFSAFAAGTKREVQNKSSMEGYRQSPPEINEELLAEMRSAFGEGETITDIISGERIKL